MFARGQTGSWKRFVSAEGGYVARYPIGWQLLSPNLPTLLVVNFPPSRSVKGVVLPRGGASVAIVPPPTGITGIEAWIYRDSKSREQESRSDIILQRTPSRQPLKLTEIKSQWGEPGEKSESVDSYFEISNRVLAGRLQYWKGDLNADQYRRVLHEIVEHVTVLHEEKGRP
jgi:hypothetical protein